MSTGNTQKGNLYIFFNEVLGLTYITDLLLAWIHITDMYYFHFLCYSFLTAFPVTHLTVFDPFSFSSQTSLNY